MNADKWRIVKCDQDVKPWLIVPPWNSPFQPRAFDSYAQAAAWLGRSPHHDNQVALPQPDVAAAVHGHAA